MAQWSPVSSPLPPTFINVNTAYNSLGSEVNVIGVVTDFLPPRLSYGTDVMSTFTIFDPSCAGHSANIEQGIRIRFFNALESEMPPVREIGDVVLIRRLRIRPYKGMTIGISHWGTLWAVFPASSIPSDATPSSQQLKHVRKAKSSAPSAAEMQYAIKLCNSQDRSSLAKSPTDPPLSRRAATGIPRDKFSLIQDVVSDNFYNLVGQVVKLYAHSDRLELYLTDYTSSNLLWNYEWGQEDKDNSGREGDVYNYLPHNTQNHKWPGPYGKMTLTVTLWPPHSDQPVKVNDFVHLGNVRIKWSNDGKFEGVLHGDRRFPERIDVSVIKNFEDDDRVKGVLRRKRDYMTKFQASCNNFVAEAKGAKRKTLDGTEATFKKIHKKKRKRDKEQLVKSKDLHVDQHHDDKLKGRSAVKYENPPMLRSQKQDLNRNSTYLSQFFSLIIAISWQHILDESQYIHRLKNGIRSALPLTSSRSNNQ